MNVTTILHNKAMEFADEALLARMEGKLEASLKFFEKAFVLEKEALDTMDNESSDPTPKYILIRSAASLALNSGNYSEAESLIQEGLNAGMPDFIRGELEDLQAQLNAIKEEFAHSEQKNYIRLVGIIIDANATTSQITVRNLENKQAYTIYVPHELLNEIIKSYWSDKVLIKALKYTAGRMVLEQIDRAA